jgi:hypothetical protein
LWMINYYNRIFNYLNYFFLFPYFVPVKMTFIPLFKFLSID